MQYSLLFVLNEQFPFFIYKYFHSMARHGMEGHIHGASKVADSSKIGEKMLQVKN